MDFDDSLRALIFDQELFPEDRQLLNVDTWKLIAFESKPLPEQPKAKPIAEPAPFPASTTPDQQLADLYYGVMEDIGTVSAKGSQLNYVDYFYNLREGALLLYTDAAKSEQIITIMLSDMVYDSQSVGEDFLGLRGSDYSFRLRREHRSEQLINRIFRKMLLLAFRNAYFMRGEPPSQRVLDYIEGRSNRLGPLDFSHEGGSLRSVSVTRAYREAVSSFLALLVQESESRGLNISCEIRYPGWLRRDFRNVPLVETSLVSNLVPRQSPLQLLRLQVDQEQLQSLIHVLKFVFPPYRNLTRRTLIVYESGITDKLCGLILSQLKAPMTHIGFPSNDLTVAAVELGIEASDRLNLE